MRKLLTSLLIIAVLVVGGVWYGKNLMTQTISTKLATMINSPSGKQALNQILASKGAKQALNQLNAQPDTSKSHLHFANEQQAVQFALSRVSLGQLLQWGKDYQQRDSLTTSQKKAIETQVLSRFSVDELKAMANTVENQNH